MKVVSSIIGKSSSMPERIEKNQQFEPEKIAPKFEWCNIQDLFYRVAENLEIDLRPFRFDMVIPNIIPLVYIDSDMIYQTIYHLVYNATRYAPEETTIRLSTAYDNGFLIIRVTDRRPNSKLRYKIGETAEFEPELSIAIKNVSAQHGTVFVTGRKDGGICFTIMILTKKSEHIIQQN